MREVRKKSHEAVFGEGDALRPAKVVSIPEKKKKNRKETKKIKKALAKKLLEQVQINKILAEKNLEKEITKEESPEKEISKEEAEEGDRASIEKIREEIKKAT